ncbi:cyclophilin-like fold protein [Streptomyces cinereoruber]|uniref:cyclophilin-like fold protein n=1 Tax=Streptomyces cinereoruber TaxID=67260 RepID=UPI003C2E7AC6
MDVLGQPTKAADPHRDARTECFRTVRPEAGTPIGPAGTAGTFRVPVPDTLDGRPVEAALNDSPAARDFADLLPLTLDLEDFHGTERVADLPHTLGTSGAPAPVASQAGGIAHYAPWGNPALFHQDGPAPSADLLVLGHLDADADRLGDATRITVEPVP